MVTTFDRRFALQGGLAISGTLMLPSLTRAVAHALPAQSMRVSGVIAIAATDDQVAWLGPDTAPQVHLAERATGRVRTIPLPHHFSGRSIAFDGDTLLVGGGWEYDVATYTYEIGDYLAEQPADIADEPGVEDWPAGGQAEMTIWSVRPAVLRLDGEDLVETTAPLEWASDLNGSVAHMMTGAAGATLVVEILDSPRRVEHFRSHVVRAATLQAEVSQSVTVLPSHEWLAHETVTTGGTLAGAGEVLALQAGDQVRFAAVSGTSVQMVQGPQVSAAAIGFTPLGELVTVEDGQARVHQLIGDTWHATDVAVVALQLGGSTVEMIIEGS